VFCYRQAESSAGIMMPVMVKTMFSLHLDGKLLAEAQRLVDAGEFDSLADMVEKALRDYLQSFDAASSDDGPDALLRRILLDGAGAGSSAAHAAAAPPSQDGVPTTGSRESADGTLDARVLKGLTDTFSGQEHDDYERLVTSYSAVAQHQLLDAEMLELAEIFRTYGLQDALKALDEAQNSKVPLSPPYLGMLLERRKPQAEGTLPQTIGTVGRVSDRPERVFADFDNPLAAAVAGLYQREIGELTEKVAEQIRTYIVEFPDLDRWHEAFDAAAGMNKRSLRYVLGVLRGNAAKVVAQKGKDKRGLSKSERHREAKRTRNKDYKEYWDAKLKAKQDSGQNK
jgi:Arc/MetJ-type ribon-helix-helix transcriptional regulator